MQPIDLIIGAFLAFLVISGGGVFLSVRRGRSLCDELARRFPSDYEALGQPYPGYFLSPRRTAYLQFVMQSEFTQLSDPVLVEQFAGLRRSEIRQIVFLVVGFAFLGIAVLWYEFIRA